LPAKGNATILYKLAFWLTSGVLAMKLEFWGAAQTVTGSMHLLKVNGHNILLDCGMYQGRRKEAFERNRQFPFDPTKIDALILSHAHIDHSGNIPSLVKQGYRGPIWTTPATRDLCAIMLRDSAFIQENDVKYVNKRRKKQGQNPFEPLYTEADVIETLNLIQTIGYRRPFHVAPGVEVHFRESGHMLGSASITLDVDEHGTFKRIVYSGDIGRQNLPILRHPQIVESADYIIMESTYGGRYHETADQARATLRNAVIDIHQKKARLIIPSFAVGRTQELVYTLHGLTDRKEIPPIKIFVDSPLAVNATEIFRLHPELYDRDTLDFLDETRSRDPFGFEGVSYIRSVQSSKALNTLDEPAVIISASGMCEAGRILHHLKNNIADPRNIILFVGYQAQHTLGRKILDGQTVVPILGEEHTVRARVMNIDGYSAHADHKGLLDWLKAAHLRSDLKSVFAVHGEEDSAQAFAHAALMAGVPNVVIPKRGESYRI
jgi:metallo-beta-lactamase family protein